jgi:hypothetical protein
MWVVGWVGKNSVLPRGERREIIRTTNEEMAGKSFALIVTGLSGLELARKKKKEDAQAAGLHLSESKTKEMTVHNITDTRLQLGKEAIEEVNEFVYLGSVISKRGGSDEDIIARTKKAKATFS